MSILQMFLGAAAGGDPVYVEDVFSTYLYDGNGSTKTITNGIDLDGEGGLVWTKCRDHGYEHSLVNTVTGVNSVLQSQSTALPLPYPFVSGFNSDGYGLASVGAVTGNNKDFVSWSFRKAPGFFDVVTWSGNSTAGREIPHSLGSVPGMIIVKCTTHTENWVVWHRSILNTQALWLQSDDDVYAQSEDSINLWNSTTPTSTAFTVGDFDGTNGDSNHSYVAYVFAHDDQSFGEGGDESIIKCGEYTGATGGTAVDCGFEPQWVLLKIITHSSSWVIRDNERNSASSTANIFPNSKGVEGTASNDLIFTATGFTVSGGGYEVNRPNASYIYVAIAAP